MLFPFLILSNPHPIDQVPIICDLVSANVAGTRSSFPFGSRPFPPSQNSSAVSMMLVEKSIVRKKVSVVVELDCC